MIHLPFGTSKAFKSSTTFSLACKILAQPGYEVLYIPYRAIRDATLSDRIPYPTPEPLAPPHLWFEANPGIGAIVSEPPAGMSAPRSAPTLAVIPNRKRGQNAGSRRASPSPISRLIIIELLGNLRSRLTSVARTEESSWRPKNGGSWGRRSEGNDPPLVATVHRKSSRNGLLNHSLEPKYAADRRTTL